MRELPAPYKILWDYLYLNCNHAGIWHVEWDVMQMRIGADAPVEQQKALELFNKGEERVIVVDSGKKWFIKGFVEFQQSIFGLSELNPANKVHASILNILKKEGIQIDISTKDTEKKPDKTTSVVKLSDFETIWAKYPRPVGKKEALRHFNASVKTEQDLKDIETSLKNYLNSARALQGFILDGSTFFNQWQDWVTYIEKMCPKCKNKGKFSNSMGYMEICNCEIGKKLKSEQPKFSATQ